MEKISIRLFGGFKITSGEEDITHILPHKKMRSLVALLILNSGRPVSHDIIVKMLWSDSDAPFTAMRTMMHRLRNILAKYEPLVSCIITNRGAYAWNVYAPADIDVYAFEAHLKKSAGARIMTRLDELLLAEKAFSGELVPELGSLFNSARTDYNNKYINCVSGISDIYYMTGENEKADLLLARAKRLVGDDPKLLAKKERNGKNAANFVRSAENASEYAAERSISSVKCDESVLKKAVSVLSGKKIFVISVSVDSLREDFESAINEIYMNSLYSLKNNAIIMLANAASYEDALKIAEDISILCGGEGVHAQYTVKEL